MRFLLIALLLGSCVAAVNRKYIRSKSESKSESKSSKKEDVCPSPDDADYISPKLKKCKKKGIDIASIQCDKEGWIPFMDDCGCGCKSPCIEDPAVPGLCKAAFLRYSFFEESNTCEPFTWGGCGGTTNNFETFDKCEKTCGLTECPSKKDRDIVRYISQKPRKCHKKDFEKIKKKCEKKGWEAFSDHCGCGCKPSPCSFEPAVVGPCEAAIPRFTYYEDTDTCEPFTYGGCQGNPNNFATLAECKESCLKDTCSLPIKPGPCRAKFAGYGYNSETRKCEDFVYGGCQGNENNFVTLEACERTCHAFDCPEEDESLRYESSNCEECTRLVYNCPEGWESFGDTNCGCGCKTVCPDKEGGNVRYVERNLEQCALVDFTCDRDPEGWVPFSDSSCGCGCWNPCTFPPFLSGFCKAAIPSFSFNPDTQKCEEFSYGGCGGTPNRFETQDECKKLCGEDDANGPDPCSLEPRVVGSCEEELSRFTYNSLTGTCDLFTYGGCEGNANNFETLEACKKTCRAFDCPEESRSLRYESGDPEVCTRVLIRCPEGWEFFGDPNCGCGCRTVCPNEEDGLVRYVSRDPEQCKLARFSKFSCEEDAVGWEFFSDHCGCGCRSPCSLPKDVGPCDDLVPRYYFNKESGQCELFDWGGCDANGNNFEEKVECEKTCGLDDASGEDPCSLDPGVAGTCEEKLPRYTFDSQSGTCEKFSYSGCGGNANSFERLEECIETCADVDCPNEEGGFVRYESKDPEFCFTAPFSCLGDPDGWAPFLDRNCGCGCWDSCLLKPGVTGFCEAFVPRYTFNQASGECEEFIYGGCGGNGNRFETQEECEDRCGFDEDNEDPCASQPGVVGSCNEAFSRYTYNAESGTCDKFTYGGCDGNANNFEDLEECVDACIVCPDEEFDDVRYDSQDPGFCSAISCEEDPDGWVPFSDISCGCGCWNPCTFKPGATGFCKASIPSYTFNPDIQECEKFNYGGCGGNPNRFETLEECEGLCVV